jgi:alkyldihydroxyacetonephosphate synthase
MRRWNGWGDEAITYPLAAAAREHLAARVGAGLALADADQRAVLAGMPASRLAPHPALTTDALDRLLHARGQSLPDWIALRSGRGLVFPDGVAYPASAEEVRALLRLAQQWGAHVIPYGGGTSVTGHINPRPGPAPVLTLDLSRLRNLTALDEVSGLAEFEAGVRGPDLEAQLRARSLTLGHFPQSFDYSTLGGWVATRSSGQQSYHYGRIEALFAGGRLETPRGPLVLPALPASAAGPDLRQAVLGSEGRLGVLTHAVVRVRPLPQTESFAAVFFHDWESGAAALRQMAQERVAVSMLRLSDAAETETTLALSGRDRLVAWADRGLRAAGYGPARCLLLYGVTGGRRQAAAAERQALEIARAHRGLAAGRAVGKLWAKTRFRTPYLRNTLWELGYALDTVETALPWSRVAALADQLLTKLRGGLAAVGERVLAFAHLSHVYPDGASLYVTYVYRRAPDPDETVERWRMLKALASQAIVAHGGTISHQHGVGADHAPYLIHEKGPLGLDMLAALSRSLDPDGLLNPGVLLPESCAAECPVEENRHVGAGVA